MPPKTLGGKNISDLSKNDILSAFAAKGNKKAQSMLQSNNQSSVSLQSNDVAQKMEELGAQANIESQSIYEQSKNSDINMRESQAFLNGLEQTPQQQAAEVQEPPQGEPVVQDTYFAGITQTLQEQRSYYEGQLKTQKDELDKRIAELKKEQQEIMKNVDSETQPFREDLEKAERERLSVEENFQANQRLTNELSSLLTQGNLLIQQRRGLPMNSRAQARLVNQSIEEVNARAGVIEAVMAARNNQIAQATTLIDRSLSAMNADRLDRLSFYETQLSLNNNEKTKLDAQSEAVYKEQMQLVKDDLTRAQTNADYIKGLMQNPETAQLMANAGVTLNDSPEQINSKLAKSIGMQGENVADRFVGDLKNFFLMKEHYSDLIPPHISSLPENKQLEAYTKWVESSKAGGARTATTRSPVSGGTVQVSNSTPGLSGYDADILTARIGKQIYGTRISDAEGERVQRFIQAGMAEGKSEFEIMDDVLGYKITRNRPLAENLRSVLLSVADEDGLAGFDMVGIARMINDGQDARAIQRVEQVVYEKAQKLDSDMYMGEATASYADSKVRQIHNQINRLPEDEVPIGVVTGTMQNWLGRLRGENAATIRASITSLVAEMRNRLSGTAVTDSEAAFLEPLIPDLSDSPNNFMRKLGELQTDPLMRVNEVRSTYNLPKLDTLHLKDKSARIGLYQESNDPLAVTTVSNVSEDNPLGLDL